MSPDFIDRISDALAGPGYFFEDEFLSPSEVSSLLEDFTLLRENFTPAKIGRNEESRRAEIQNEIRRDSTLWFDCSHLTPSQRMLWDRLEELRLGLNARLTLGLWELEGHFADYLPGGFYRKHLDRFQSNDARTISIVFYLNKNWQPAHGGSLRIYADGSSIDIEPHAGRLVCFLSERIEHEVLESFVERRSFAGWYRRRS